MRRLFDNWVTSILGLIIFALACILLSIGKIDYVSFGAMGALTLTFLRAKDSLIGLEAK